MKPQIEPALAAQRLNRFEMAVWRARKFLTPEAANEYRRLLDKLGMCYPLKVTVPDSGTAPHFWSVGIGQTLRP